MIFQSKNNSDEYRDYTRFSNFFDDHVIFGGSIILIMKNLKCLLDTNVLFRSSSKNIRMRLNRTESHLLSYNKKYRILPLKNFIYF